MTGKSFLGWDGRKACRVHRHCWCTPLYVRGGYSWPLCIPPEGGQSASEMNHQKRWVAVIPASLGRERKAVRAAGAACSLCYVLGCV